MARPKLLVAGNWKMHGTTAALSELEAIRDGLPAGIASDIVVFPPATLLPSASAVLRETPVRTGAQDCHAELSGAFTGDISAAMVKDAGASYVLLGHSERRTLHGELSHRVKAKAGTVLKLDMIPLICVGETAGERDCGLTIDVCRRQLHDSLPAAATPDTTVIAYEPVWAIGSGAVPNQSDLEFIFKSLRESLGRQFPALDTNRWRLLYGGSVTPANAAAIFAVEGVDGVLAGGASLKAASFLSIIEAAQRAPVRS